MTLRLTFSMLPLRCFSNLFVNASLSRNRWSGLRSGWAAEGMGKEA